MAKETTSYTYRIFFFTTKFRQFLCLFTQITYRTCIFYKWFFSIFSKKHWYFFFTCFQIPFGMNKEWRKRCYHYMINMKRDFRHCFGIFYQSIETIFKCKNENQKWSVEKAYILFITGTEMINNNNSKSKKKNANQTQRRNDMRKCLKWQQTIPIKQSFY